MSLCVSPDNFSIEESGVLKSSFISRLILTGVFNSSRLLFMKVGALEFGGRVSQCSAVT